MFAWNSSLVADDSWRSLKGAPDRQQGGEYELNEEGDSSHHNDVKTGKDQEERDQDRWIESRAQDMDSPAYP